MCWRWNTPTHLLYDTRSSQVRSEGDHAVGGITIQQVNLYPLNPGVTLSHHGGDSYTTVQNKRPLNRDELEIFRCPYAMLCWPRELEN